ncbi:MAG: M36 family metallopeptidase, partial [Bacteroidota bacterium]|nr:M36 family metallopeptidase [Bacteroidota bacterium]
MTLKTMRPATPAFFVLPLMVVFLTFTTNTFCQTLSSTNLLKKYVERNGQKWGLLANEAQNLVVTKEYVDNTTGIQHIYATQSLNGLTIAGTSFSLHTTANKQVDANNLVPVSEFKVNPVVTSVTSSDAVIRLMNDIGYAAEKKFDLKEPAKGADQVTIYKRTEYSMWNIPVRLVYYNIARLKTLQPAWEVQMMDTYRQHYWVAYVDAKSGKILEKTDVIKHCNFGGAETDAHLSDIKPEESVSATRSSTNAASYKKSIAQLAPEAIIANSYRVYDLPLENPIDSIQQPALHSVSNRSGDTLSSPDGWHRINAGATTYNYTRGNNVWAFQDPSPGPLGGVPSADPTRTAFPTNGPIPGTYPLTEPFVFDYSYDQSKQPEDKGAGNQSNYYAAIVNLFYWNNLMHDVFYYMGFNEAAGNFEESHLFSNNPTTPRGKATGQGDEVLAQAQDGGGTNNANFFTPPGGDGLNGQMQMYLWTTASADSLVQIRASSHGVPPPGKKYLAVQGSFNSNPAAKNNLYTDSVSRKPFAIVQKNAASTVGTSSQGCSAGQQSVALPSQNVSGKIALIDRGGCSFVEKVLGAQAGGAVGVIVINNVDGPPIAMGGSDAPGNAIVIPAVMISLKDGKELKDVLVSGDTINGSLRADKPPLPKRDGDIDNGVISHEYGHGISTRLTGTLGGAEQGGEGWSDFVALYMTLRNNDLDPATTGHPN